MNFNQKILLISYADSMGKNLQEMHSVLNRYFQKAVGGVHILPFFPSSADRGFAPTTYRQVDPSFGTWDDIQALSRDYYLMADYMINHLSRKSTYFQDFILNHDRSRYRDLFLRYKNFWPGGEASEEDLNRVYKRKERPPYSTVRFADGTEEKLWCTFDEEQMDLDVRSETTKRFNRENLSFLAEHGISFIRLDAFAYAVKKAGTNCFFVEPEIWELLGECRSNLAPYGVQILPEVHEHYRYQLKMAEQDYWVYDFALPMLVLYTLYSGKKERLLHWLQICPRKQFTTLDTHDGIGIVDAKDLLTDEEIRFTKDYLFTNGANIKPSYNTAEYNNLDIYQINCTYYSALGDNDRSYLLARAIQFFSPGVPQVYYVGMLAGKNDIKLLEQTKVGRNIHRHYYSSAEIDREMERPVVRQLLQLMEFRNTCDAFNGEMRLPETGAGHLLCIEWEKAGKTARLEADLKAHTFRIFCKEKNQDAPELKFEIG